MATLAEVNTMSNITKNRNQRSVNSAVVLGDYMSNLSYEVNKEDPNDPNKTIKTFINPIQTFRRPKDDPGPSIGAIKEGSEGWDVMSEIIEIEDPKNPGKMKKAFKHEEDLLKIYNSSPLVTSYTDINTGETKRGKAVGFVIDNQDRISLQIQGEQGLVPKTLGFSNDPKDVVLFTNKKDMLGDVNMILLGNQATRSQGANTLGAATADGTAYMKGREDEKNALDFLAEQNAAVESGEKPPGQVAQEIEAAREIILGGIDLLEKDDGTSPDASATTTPTADYVGPTNKISMQESSNNPNALWKNSETDTFKDQPPVAEQTLAEVLEFVKIDGKYANWSKTQNNPASGGSGKIHTPVGKYQFVGATLRDIKTRGGFDELGITDDTVFSEETQDKLFSWYIKDTIQAAETDGTDPKAKIRGRFEGIGTTDDMSDQELDTVISQVQDGTYASSSAQTPATKPSLVNKADVGRTDLPFRTLDTGSDEVQQANNIAQSILDDPTLILSDEEVEVLGNGIDYGSQFNAGGRSGAINFAGLNKQISSITTQLTNLKERDPNEVFEKRVTNLATVSQKTVTVADKITELEKKLEDKTKSRLNIAKNISKNIATDTDSLNKAAALKEERNQKKINSIQAQLNQNISESRRKVLQAQLDKLQPPVAEPDVPKVTLGKETEQKFNIPAPDFTDIDSLRQYAIDNQVALQLIGTDGNILQQISGILNKYDVKTEQDLIKVPPADLGPDFGMLEVLAGIAMSASGQKGFLDTFDKLSTIYGARSATAVQKADYNAGIIQEQNRLIQNQNQFNSKENRMSNQFDIELARKVQEFKQKSQDTRDANRIKSTLELSGAIEEFALSVKEDKTGGKVGYFNNPFNTPDSTAKFKKVMRQFKITGGRDGGEIGFKADGSLDMTNINPLALDIMKDLVGQALFAYASSNSNVGYLKGFWRDTANMSFDDMMRKVKIEKDVIKGKEYISNLVFLNAAGERTKTAISGAQLSEKFGSEGALLRAMLLSYVPKEQVE
tara:strand:+ start:406 stop:3447 length:3042 start_codon:yes stop_codon:yes gene_type:complete